MTLNEGTPGNQYEVLNLETEDEELENFLFTLGCYAGETIGFVSMVGGSYVISIKDGRYNIDLNLAKAIVIQ